MNFISLHDVEKIECETRNVGKKSFVTSLDIRDKKGNVVNLCLYSDDLIKLNIKNSLKVEGYK